MLQVIQDPGRVFCGYSKLEKLKPDHLATIKSFMLQKEVKKFPKLLQRSNSVRDKIHMKSIHRKHITL